jgi:hypothetical protein
MLKTIGDTDLRFHIKYSDQPAVMYGMDCVELGAVHVLIMCAVLEVRVSCDVIHHVVVCNKKVVYSVLLVLLRRPRCVYVTQTTSDTVP